MQSQYTNQKSNPIKNGLETFSHGHQSQLNVWEGPNIQKKVDLKLYLHFEQMLNKSFYHYNKISQFFEKAVSKEQIVSETIKYLKYFTENIKHLSSQHSKQLLFLIDIFNKEKRIISNLYWIETYSKDSNSPANFYLGFYYTKQRIDLKQFLRFNDWNHVVKLCFNTCPWFKDDDWKGLLELAGKFGNLKWLELYETNITTIREGDIEQFESLQEIDLQQSPLSEQSKKVLSRLKQKNDKITIHFDK